MTNPAFSLRVLTVWPLSCAWRGNSEFDDLVIFIFDRSRFAKAREDRSAELTSGSDIHDKATSSRLLASRGPLEFKGEFLC